MSSGINSRQSYEDGAYMERLKRSNSELHYRLNTSFANNDNPCVSTHGPRLTKSVDFIGNQIDLESTLRNTSKYNSKINTAPSEISKYKPHLLNECSNRLESENTRHTNPAYDIRGLNTRDLNFSYPLFDPQCQIFENFEVNTRLQSKDKHKAIWHKL